MGVDHVVSMLCVLPLCQLAVSVHCSYNKQMLMYCILFQKALQEGLLELFFPREINRELVLFWNIAVYEEFSYYLSLWLLQTCTGDFVFVARFFLFFCFSSLPLK